MMLRRTTITDLAVPFLVLAVLSYFLLKLAYESLPEFQWYPAAPIIALAAAEFVVARRVRAAVRHVPDARPMTAFAIARAVALGKASALVGSGVAGAVLGLLLTVLPDAGRTPAAGHDLRIAVVLLVAALLITAAGLAVERSGIDPNAGRS
ncbi:MAG: hypothetical protein JWO63_1030 [Frankiales bacterium]|jgi:hypothetical protein|nr:hypothetical protein [Frankiales bacterium]